MSAPSQICCIFEGTQDCIDEALLVIGEFLGGHEVIFERSVVIGGTAVFNPGSIDGLEFGL